MEEKTAWKYSRTATREEKFEQITETQKRLLEVRDAMMELVHMGVLTVEDFSKLNALGKRMQKYSDEYKPEYKPFSFTELWKVIEEEKKGE